MGNPRTDAEDALLRLLQDDVPHTQRVRDFVDSMVNAAAVSTLERFQLQQEVKRERTPEASGTGSYLVVMRLPSGQNVEQIIHAGSNEEAAFEGCKLLPDQHRSWSLLVAVRPA